MVNKLKIALACACLGALIGAWPSGGQYGGKSVNITTDRVDNSNSAWNQNETILTVANAPNIKLKATATVDDQVDAQPLIYNGSMYVVTANNTIYRINATTGKILTSRNVGTAVPQQALYSCTNGSPHDGILSAPVIDPTTNIMYLVSYQYPGNIPTYKLYAVDTQSLLDRIAPKTIALTATLANGASYGFNASVSKQRPALKMFGSNIYMGFGSFCDFFTSTTRGWVLGLDKTSLNFLTTGGALMDYINPDTVDSPAFYLTSVWQSGAGPAIDTSGNVFAVTGNTGTGTAGYTELANLDCSLIKFSATLTIADWMQRSAPAPSCNAPLGDADASGMGAILLPDIPNCTQDFRGVGGPLDQCVHLAVFGSKDGCCFVVNRDDMGHTFENPPGSTNGKLIQAYGGGLNGFYTPSWFYGSDNALRVASCGDGSFGVSGFQINTFILATSFTGPPNNLFQYTNTADQNLGSNITNSHGTGYNDGQDGCGMWTVSSSGTLAGTHIIWVVSRPRDLGGGNEQAPILYATNPLNGAQLMSSSLPTWNTATLNGNMNAAPVVANGHVYYCTYQKCVIYGL